MEPCRVGKDNTVWYDDVLIDNRADKGRRGMQGATISREFAGDYDTPEEQIGGFNRRRPWKTCLELGR